MAIECPKCHTENPSESSFCSKCGASLAVDLGSLSPTRTILGPVLRLKKGQMIGGKYKIIQKIGEGGMGIVYKAEDTKLKRHVALKFLPSELTRDKKAEARFIQEAQAAAALNHPHICIIHEVDEADDQTFIAMEFIEGQTLKDKIEAGPLAIDEAVDIASQVAEGLGEAHKKGIVHRDIKPANIMLTANGQAKIMDFGLAKLSWGADLTKPSMIMGTVAYMSPEQARGEEVDSRTDIWSLGVVLYEMLTGELPFKGDRSEAVIHSILNTEPESVTPFRPDVPGHVEMAIVKALEKDGMKRCQSAEDMIRALNPSPPFIFPTTECSIVVLPFEDLSPGKDNEYFSDGLTEEIITDLSQVRTLCVISRNSAMALKGTRKNTKTIGRELNVQHVLEGSVRKAGNNLRITAQLIDAKSDIHLWAEKYSGTLDDIFDIQEKVSKSIVDSLKLKLTPAEQLHMAERPIKNIQAYECYLKANYELWSRYTKDSIEKAIHLAQQGLDVVGPNELLITTMGMAYFQYVNTGVDPDERYLDKAEAYVQEAFKLNPDSAHGYVLLSMIYETRGNFPEAVKLTKKAFELDPNNSMALLMLGCLYAWIGKPDAAKSLNDRLETIDPLNPINRYLPWWIYVSEGRFDKALEVLKKMFETDRGNSLHRLLYAWMLMSNHREEEALELIERHFKEDAETTVSSLGAFTKYVLKGDKEGALSALTPDAIKLAEIDHIYSCFLADLYAVLGIKDKAIKWLENAVNRGRIDYPFFAERDPLLENIRGEPRFKNLMERVKHEWENFEV